MDGLRFEKAKRRLKLKAELKRVIHQALEESGVPLPQQADAFAEVCVELDAELTGEIERLERVPVVPRMVATSRRPVTPGIQVEQSAIGRAAWPDGVPVPKYPPPPPEESEPESTE